MPLTQNDIESELSYAYLHAVATRAGMNCTVSNRHSDNYQCDAEVQYFGPIPNTYITDIHLRIQLKATVATPVETDSHLSYFYRGIEQYDNMRIYRGASHRILVVLYLPNLDTEWLNNNIDSMVLKKCAYWVCLYGAPQSNNDSG